MNGPEHYLEAERLLAGDAVDMAAAQVHATLALAAAVAMEPRPKSWVRDAAGDAWSLATGADDARGRL